MTKIALVALTTCLGLGACASLPVSIETQKCVVDEIIARAADGHKLTQAEVTDVATVCKVDVEDVLNRVLTAKDAAAE